MKKLHSFKVSTVGELTAPQKFSESAWFNFLKAKLSSRITYLVRAGKVSRKQGNDFLSCWLSQFCKLPRRSFQPTLVHNDLHLDNVIMTPTKKLFLIDFEDSFYGDPLYDLVTFSDFHPKLFPKLKKFYNNKAVLSNGWQEWFKIYEFIHWVSLGSFYVDIGKERIYHKYLSKILNFCRQRKT